MAGPLPDAPRDRRQVRRADDEADRPLGLRTFAKEVGLPLSIVHQTRNPYDTIARRSLVLRDGVPKRTLAESIAEIAAMADVNAQLIAGGRYPVARSATRT